MRFGKYIIIAASSIGLIAGVASLAPAPALAQTGQVPQVRVHYGDLDLSRRAGAEILISRLRRGAKQACSQEGFLSDLRGYGMYRDCLQRGVDKAVAAVGTPMVTEAYRRQYGESLVVAGN